MAQTEKLGNIYRARYYDPLGRRYSKTFTRKADGALPPRLPPPA